jgi:hypothetical protein
MSIVKKTGLLVGVIGAAATLASAAQAGEGGEGGHGRRVYAPYYWVAPPPVVYVPTRVYSAPPPVVYVPAQPIYDVPANPSININIPLR